jgi:hypothetical protein
MGTARAQGTNSESGQASVEFLGVLPAVLLAALAAWQFAIAGHALWAAGNAARVAARADAVGADPRPAARQALPAYLRRGLRVDGGDGRAIAVRLRVPFVLGAAGSPLRVSASAALPQR